VGKLFHVQIVIVISEFLERHLKAKRTRAPTYSRAKDDYCFIALTPRNSLPKVQHEPLSLLIVIPWQKRLSLTWKLRRFNACDQCNRFWAFKGAS